MVNWFEASNHDLTPHDIINGITTLPETVGGILGRPNVVDVAANEQGLTSCLAGGSGGSSLANVLGLVKSCRL